MRRKPNIPAERGRTQLPGYPETKPGELRGCFRIEKGPTTITVISSGADVEADGWEHVSVSIFGEKRCPTWDEMVYVKDLFWGPEETVIEYHPAAEDYVNVHNFVLHLWRPQRDEVPMPPRVFV